MEENPKAWPYEARQTTRKGPKQLLLLLFESLKVDVRETATEGVNASFRIDKLLLASVEGVALRADTDGLLGHRGFALEGGAAGAGHRALDVLGMDVFLHGRSSFITYLKKSF